MPVLFGVAVSSATYSDPNLTVAGDGFGDNQYPVSAVDVSLDGSSWTTVTITSWANDAISGTAASLPAGTYRVRVTSSDNEQATLLSAFTVSTTGGIAIKSRSRIAIAIGIGL